MTVKQHLVGSGGKGLITQNANEPIDLDYNIEIINCIKYHIDDGRSIKNYIKQQFDDLLKKYGWKPCQDSTSALTTQKQNFNHANKTKFSIDLCIVRINKNGNWNRLIHQKTGNVKLDKFIWNTALKSKGLINRVDWLKKHYYWTKVREKYLEKKNMYLIKGEHNHHSFNIYIETINEIYSKYNQNKKVLTDL